MNEIILMNENPTKTEKKLFRYDGYYLFEKTDFYCKYVQCYPQSRADFPTNLNLSITDIDFKKAITFYSDAELVEVSGMVDTEVLGLIQERTKELQWN